MLLTPILSLLAPHECLGCSAEGALLCVNCRLSLPDAEPRCYSCERPSPLFRTCGLCQAKSPLFAVHAATPYKGAAKNLIWKLKFGRAQAAAHEIAAMLAERAAFASPGRVIITHVPTATTRVRQRGYDQAALIAKSFAATAHVTYKPLLMRQGKHKQMGASRAVRAQQLREAFRPVRLKHIQGAHIILIDDVVTTGATLEAAAYALKRAGAERVQAIVFAQA